MSEPLRQIEQFGDLEFCGFVCRACNFRLRVADPLVAEGVIELFNRRADFTSLTCPECGFEQQYGRDDLKAFLPRGRESTLPKRSGPQRQT